MQSSEILYESQTNLRSQAELICFQETKGHLRPEFIQRIMTALEKSKNESESKSESNSQEALHHTLQDTLQDTLQALNISSVYPPFSDNIHGLIDPFFVDLQTTVHRSGWRFVMQGIQDLFNSSAPLLVDFYVDRTFSEPCLSLYKASHLVPYKKDWLGILHHTFDTSMCSSNLTNLFNNNDFLQCLDNCKGLITLSHHLQYQVSTRLRELNIIVPVYCIPHPTDLDTVKFKYSNFIQNSQKYVMFVGDFLRNSWFFYNLKLPKRLPFTQKVSFFCNKTITCPVKKVILKGNKETNCLPPKHFIHHLKTCLCKCPDQSNNGLCVSCNQFIVSFINDVKHSQESVMTLDYKTNDEFDDLLSKNIVLINLVDASAVNTVLECIARNTPILVNKLPALVEILGDTYPLFYNNEVDLYRKLASPKWIYQGYKYLKQLDKSKLHLVHFRNEFIKVVSGILTNIN